MNSLLSLTIESMRIFFKRPLRDQVLMHSKYVYSELFPLRKILAQISVPGLDSCGSGIMLGIRGGGPIRYWAPSRWQASTGPSRSPVACSVQESVSEPESCPCCLIPTNQRCILKSYTPAHHSADCSPLPAKQKPEETDT